MILWVLLSSVLSFASPNDVDKAALNNYNLLTNPGFENGKTGWTASGGSFSLVTSGSTLMYGKSSITWDSNASAQTLTSASMTIPKGMYGKKGIAYCTVKVSTSNLYKLRMTDTNGTVSVNLPETVTTPKRIGLTFTFATSGTMTISILSTQSNEPLLNMDDCFVGQAESSGLLELFMDTGNGHGSTDTKIRRFTNTREGSLGAGGVGYVTISDGATTGTTIEVNIQGLYAIEWTDAQTGGTEPYCVTVNEASMTTNCSGTFTYAQGARIRGFNSTNLPGITSGTIYLYPGDIVRFHDEGGSNLTNADSYIKMVYLRP